MGVNQARYDRWEQEQQRRDFLRDHVEVINVTPNFGTLGIGEDPDEYDRLRDLGYFDDCRYSGKESWK